MANNCITMYSLDGAPERVNKALKLLDDLAGTDRSSVVQERFRARRDADPCWLGYLAEALGLDPDKVPCAGSFSGQKVVDRDRYNWDGDSWVPGMSLVFATDTAWDPCAVLAAEFGCRFKLRVNYMCWDLLSAEFRKWDPSGDFADSNILFSTSGDEIVHGGERFFKTEKGAIRFVRRHASVPDYVRGFAAVSRWVAMNGVGVLLKA